MERVKSWDWSMIVMALCIGALGMRLLLDRPAPDAPTPTNTAAIGPKPVAAGVMLTPRLVSLLSEGDR